MFEMMWHGRPKWVALLDHVIKEGAKKQGIL